MGPSLQAILKRISGAHEWGILAKTFPASTGRSNPSLCNNKRNAWLCMMLHCSKLQATIGVDSCNTEIKFTLFNILFQRTLKFIVINITESFLYKLFYIKHALVLLFFQASYRYLKNKKMRSKINLTILGKSCNALT